MRTNSSAFSASLLLLFASSELQSAPLPPPAWGGALRAVGPFENFDTIITGPGTTEKTHGDATYSLSAVATGDGLPSLAVQVSAASDTYNVNYSAELGLTYYFEVLGPGNSVPIVVGARGSANTQETSPATDSHAVAEIRVAGSASTATSEGGRPFGADPASFDFVKTQDIATGIRFSIDIQVFAFASACPVCDFTERRGHLFGLRGPLFLGPAGLHPSS